MVLQWSQSKKCWHLPYTKEAYTVLQEHFEISLPIAIPTAPIKKGIKSKEKQTAVFYTKQAIPKNGLVIKVLPEHDFRVKVFVPYQQKDWIEKIKSLPNRAWNAEQRYWSVPKTEETLDLLKNYFGKVLQIDAFIIWDKKLPMANKNMEVVTPIDKEIIPPLNEKAFIPETDFPPASLSKSSFCTNFQKKYKEIKQYGKTYKIFLGEIVRIEMHNANWLKVYVTRR